MEVEALLSGCVVSKGRDVGVYAVSLAEAAGTRFYALIGNGASPSGSPSDWASYSLEVDWPAVGMASLRYPGEADLLVLAVGAAGEFWELRPGGPSQEAGRIAPGLSGVTRVAAVGAELWCCGMGRAVWARDAAGTWRDLSAPAPSPEEAVVGFTALAALPDRSALAAGWGGELWLHGAHGWRREVSGTRANLNAASVDERGNVVVVGDGGVLVEGRPGQWRMSQADAALNLTGVSHFQGHVFVCSEFDLFLWQDGRLIPEERFAGSDRPRSCLNLLPGGSTLASQGERDLFVFSEGRWSRVL